MGDKTIIVTSYGLDGACAAAMALQKYPKALLKITSARRITDTLQEIIDLSERPGSVVICGLGLPNEREPLLAVLRACKRQKVSVYWYCGRGYLNDYEPTLAAECKPIFLECATNTEAVYRSFKIEDSETIRLLLTLAEEFVSKKKKLAADHQFWHDLVNGSSDRYFKYGDGMSFIHAIQKLAGLSPLTDADQKLALFHKQNGRYIPLGDSPAMKELRALIQRLAPVEEPVLILGPTGVGKEIAARMLHESSRRNEGPFVPVNCAILSTNPDLAHDRLFGHVAGAFTGAKYDQSGAFEIAESGTLFLDELAELPLPVQTQLLRVLEEGTITPLGAMQSRPVNVRILAATNQNLYDLLSEKKFRMDLYHRLNVLELRIPPLQERREDMIPIARSLIYELKQNGYSLCMEEEDWQAAMKYDWPGNIRQFINLLKRSAYLGVSLRVLIEKEKISSSATANQVGKRLTEDDRRFLPLQESEIVPEAEIRRVYMTQVLKLCRGNWSKAAQRLQVSINTLRKWAEKDEN